MVKCGEENGRRVNRKYLPTWNIATGRRKRRGKNFWRLWKKSSRAIIKTSEDNLQLSYQKRRFSTFHSDLNRFADWLHAKDCLDMCMESTWKYRVPVFNILEKWSIRVVIANPRWVNVVKGNKDDTKDSKWIGDLSCIDLVNSSFIPAKDIRILRELTWYRCKLTSMKSSEKNRFQNAFTVCNVVLDSVVSNMFGKSAAAITDYLTSNEDFDARHCISLR